MLISVVAPLYNKQENFHIRAERVAAALSNFAGQFEIILVDDGSRDNTAKQIETLAVAMPEVRPVTGTKLWPVHGHTSGTGGRDWCNYCNDGW